MTATRRGACAALAAALFALAPAAAGSPAGNPESESEGLELISSTPFTYAYDVERLEVPGRSLAVVTTLPAAGAAYAKGGELAVFDVADPARPRKLGSLRCRRGHIVDAAPTSRPHLVAAFAGSGGEETCLGIDSFGFALVDVSRPARPRVVGTALHDAGANSDLPKTLGSFPGRSMYAHPSEPYLYTTRVLSQEGELHTWSLATPGEPKLVSTQTIPYAPYDLAVDPAGTVAAVAAGSDFVTYDLSDPASPQLASVQVCPGCTKTVMTRFLGDTLMIYDEGSSPAYCPSGALYFYDVVSGTPVLKGVYNPSRLEPDPALGPVPRMCQADSMDVSPDGTRLLLNWRHNSVRIFEVSDTTGAGLNEAGAGPVVETGWFRADTADIISTRFLTDGEVVAADVNFGLYTLRAE